MKALIASLNGNIFRCWRRTVRFRCYGNLSAVTALPASVYRTDLYQKRLIIQQFFSIKFINCQRIYRCFDNFCFSIICNGNLIACNIYLFIPCKGKDLASDLCAYILRDILGWRRDAVLHIA